MNYQNESIVLHGNFYITKKILNRIHNIYDSYVIILMTIIPVRIPIEFMTYFDCDSGRYKSNYNNYDTTFSFIYS